MRKISCMAFTLVMSISVVFFSVSCAKDSVQVRSTENRPPEISKDESKDAELVVKTATPKEAPAASPVEAPAPEPAESEFVYENILFAFDSALLSDEARQILIRTADHLGKNPNLSITVEGHCDERGANDYNLALGDRRAKSVKDYLVSLGIGADRLDTISYGEERPIALGRDEASWEKNRRAQFAFK